MKIPVYQPYLAGNEKKYVNQCLDSSWISSKGEFIDKFECGFAEYVGIKHATSVANGTVALHLALTALGLQPGDEVIVPTFTYIASVNAIKYIGATPIFVDSIESTLQMDPTEVLRKISSKTKAVIAVHLYGHSCDMTALVKICETHQLFLIEDCAQAFGSYYQGKHVGTFGQIATFSFYGNKTLTTGEGGMVITNITSLHERSANLKNQGISNSKQYQHDVIGYNFRMTNIQAAIGLAQLEQAHAILARKSQLAQWYKKYLSGLPLILLEGDKSILNSFWMCSIMLNDATQREPLRDYLLQQHGIETRPFFYPVHTLLPYADNLESYPQAETISKKGLNLPSWPDLSEQQCEQISLAIHQWFTQQ